MIGVTTAIKDDTTDTFLPGTLGNQLTHLMRNRHFPIAGNTLQRFNRRPLHTFLCAGQLGFNLSSRLAPLAGSSLLWLSPFRRPLLRLGPFSPGRSGLSRYLHGCRFRFDLFWFNSFLRWGKVTQNLISR